MECIGGLHPPTGPLIEQISLCAPMLALARRLLRYIALPRTARYFPASSPCVEKYTDLGCRAESRRLGGTVTSPHRLLLHASCFAVCCYDNEHVRFFMTSACLSLRRHYPQACLSIQRKSSLRLIGLSFIRQWLPSMIMSSSKQAATTTLVEGHLPSIYSEF